MRDKVLNTSALPIAPWLDAGGPDADVVLSSRVRIARNINGVHFPAKATEEERQNVLQTLAPALATQLGNNVLLKTGMNELSALERNFLVERRLVSRELAKCGSGSGVIIDSTQRFSAMINEEDHLRCQSVRPGLNIEEPLRELEEILAGVESGTAFAFHPQLGYLTSCPTNVGTGIRASVMLHLPGLVFQDWMESVLRAAGALGMSLRGLFGEGSAPLGNVFQVSNQSTLGEDESTICCRLERIATQLIRSERTARQKLLRDEPARFADHVARSFATLKYARIIGSQEALGALFAVRLGLCLGMFAASDCRGIHQLIQDIHPAHLQSREGRELQDSERDQARAVLIRPNITYIESGTKRDE